MPDWWATKDGDVNCLKLYNEHYSSYDYADGRQRKLFCREHASCLLVGDMYESTDGVHGPKNESS